MKYSLIDLNSVQVSLMLTVMGFCIISCLHRGEFLALWTATNIFPIFAALQKSKGQSVKKEAAGIREKMRQKTHA